MSARDTGQRGGGDSRPLSDAEKSARRALAAAREHYEHARYSEAAEGAARILAAEPDNTRAMMVRGRALIALSRVREARALFQRIGALEPGNRMAKLHALTLKRLADGEPSAASLRVASEDVPPVLEIDSVADVLDGEAPRPGLDRVLAQAAAYVTSSEIRDLIERHFAIRLPLVSQQDDVDLLRKSAEAPVLIAVGGGIGDMLQATPMIANVSRRLGRRVDIVVTEEYERTLFLLHSPDYVNAVYGLSQIALARSYDTVFVTHFFGEARVPFSGRRVVWSRDRAPYRFGAAHATLFNLEMARDLLGISFDEEDTRRYFVGDIAYRRPTQPLIGIHAGSKTGHWEQKRWPYFAALAERLERQGHRVASFGTADEYVEGTEDRTGGTIEEMCRAMADCSFFVANDSGVMNIANALGIPVLALFGPTDAETLLPLRQTSAAIALDKSCAPCKVKDPKFFSTGECRCIAEIGVDVVEARVLALLAGPPAERIIRAR